MSLRHALCTPVRALATACCILAGTAPALAAPAENCTVPPILAAGTRLAHAPAALVAGGISIVAIGSSSTQGAGASGPAATYPAQLDRMLEARYPKASVEVVNAGIGGETAAENLARFDRDVLSRRPQLVIWQVGTNDGLRGVDPGIFRENLRDGIARLRAIGAEVLLMEPQYYPGETKVPAQAAMIESVREIGGQLGVPVLRRHAIMRSWLDEGHLTLATMLSPDGLHMTDDSYRCLAGAVAELFRPAEVVSGH